MPLEKKATFGNVVEVKGGYRPQSHTPSISAFGFKTLVSRFLKRRIPATTTTATTLIESPSPRGLRRRSPQRGPRDEVSPILQFRPKSIYEVLNNGTKLGENDADGVGLPTGNGGGDMEGVIIRDFADGLGGVGGNGVGGVVVDEYEDIGRRMQMGSGSEVGERFGTRDMEMEAALM